MLHCWAADPDERPTFAELHNTMLTMMAVEASLYSGGGGGGIRGWVWGGYSSFYIFLFINMQNT